jgi:hypothetical protein
MREEKNERRSSSKGCAPRSNLRCVDTDPKKRSWWEFTQASAGAFSKSQGHPNRAQLLAAERASSTTAATSDEPFDFLNWFEFAPTHEAEFNALLSDCVQQRNGSTLTEKSISARARAAQVNSDTAEGAQPHCADRVHQAGWHLLVMTAAEIDRAATASSCALRSSARRVALRRHLGQGHAQFKDFEDYLVPPAKFASLKQASELPLAVATDCDQYLHDRLTLLETQLATVNRMALANELPDAIITESGLKITPLDAAVPDTAQALIDQTAMILPHVKITELLLEVDEWTGFTRHFAHLKSGDLAKDKTCC